jgi:hypothetical protein
MEVNIKRAEGVETQINFEAGQPLDAEPRTRDAAP